MEPVQVPVPEVERPPRRPMIPDGRPARVRLLLEMEVAAAEEDSRSEEVPDRGEEAEEEVEEAPAAEG